MLLLYFNGMMADKYDIKSFFRTQDYDQMLAWFENKNATYVNRYVATKRCYDCCLFRLHSCPRDYKVQPDMQLSKAQQAEANNPCEQFKPNDSYMAALEVQVMRKLEDVD